MLKHVKYAGLIFVLLCAIHVVIHMLAYVSVNWGGYLVLVSIILMGRSLRVMESRHGYVSIAHYCIICGLLVWAFTWACSATYWQYYYVAWAYACLVLAVALDKNNILMRVHAHILA
jgi:hypothetical protein